MAASRRAVCPPRAPRRARFPRPPLEKRDGQFNISLPDRDRFIFVSSFAAYLATYPSAADRDRFTFVSSFAAYLATYRSAGVKAPRGLLNLWRMRSLALLSSSPLRPDGPTRTQFPVQSLFEVELSTKGLRTLFSSVSIYCAFPPCSPAPRAPELSSSVSIFCAITVCSESQPSPLSAPSPFSDYK